MCRNDRLRMPGHGSIRLLRRTGLAFGSARALRWRSSRSARTEASGQPAIGFALARHTPVPGAADYHALRATGRPPHSR